VPRSLKFRVSSELKNIIGKELITDDFIAVFELVKNSYDANAKKVELVFKYVKNREDAGRAEIFVIDDGDGMSYSDLRSKWLLVGYSEKSELEKKLESRDFRDKIAERRIFAGAKGIGRFSCDRLGSKLRLYTKKSHEPVIHQLEMDWGKFEGDPNTQFQEIDVVYSTPESLDSKVPVTDFEKGTILEIYSLRSEWNRSKLLTLKRHLQRLINPAQISQKQEFRIYLNAEEYLEKDEEQEEDYDKVNGLVGCVHFG